MKPHGACSRTAPLVVAELGPGDADDRRLTGRSDAAAPGSGAPAQRRMTKQLALRCLSWSHRLSAASLAGERPDLDPVEHAVGGVRALEERLDAAQHRAQIDQEQIPGAPGIGLVADRGELDAEVAIGRDRRRRVGLSAAVSVAAPRGCAPRARRSADRARRTHVRAARGCGGGAAARGLLRRRRRCDRDCAAPLRLVAAGALGGLPPAGLRGAGLRARPAAAAAPSASAGGAGSCGGPFVSSAGFAVARARRSRALGHRRHLGEQAIERGLGLAAAARSGAGCAGAVGDPGRGSAVAAPRPAASLPAPLRSARLSGSRRRLAGRRRQRLLGQRQQALGLVARSASLHSRPTSPLLRGERVSSAWSGGSLIALPARL